MPSRRIAQEFLSQRRIAVVGLSRNHADFSHRIYEKLQQTGHELYAVNPNAGADDAIHFYPSVKDLPEPVDGALILVPPAASATVVRECQAVGIRRVWLHRGAGSGAVSPEAVAVAREAGMSVVDGACPFMFLGGFPHKIHRLFVKMEA